MSSLFDFGIRALATKRITRFVTEDELAEPIRENDFVHKHEKLQYLVNCPYCVSIYAGAAVVVSSMLFPRTAKAAHYALALAEVVALSKDYQAQREALEEDFGPPL